MRDAPRNADPSQIRNGYRLPSEPPDERPLVVFTELGHPHIRDGQGRIIDAETVGSPRGFWDSETERMTYEHAVQANPRRASEGLMDYIMRIGSIARGRLLGPAVRAMPEVRLPYRDDE